MFPEAIRRGAAGAAVLFTALSLSRPPPVRAAPRDDRAARRRAFQQLHGGAEFETSVEELKPGASPGAPMAPASSSLSPAAPGRSAAGARRVDAAGLRDVLERARAQSAAISLDDLARYRTLKQIARQLLDGRKYALPAAVEAALVGGLNAGVRMEELFLGPLGSIDRDAWDTHYAVMGDLARHADWYFHSEPLYGLYRLVRITRRAVWSGSWDESSRQYGKHKHSMYHTSYELLAALVKRPDLFGGRRPLYLAANAALNAAAQADTSKESWQIIVHGLEPLEAVLAAEVHNREQRARRRRPMLRAVRPYRAYCRAALGAVKEFGFMSRHVKQATLTLFARNLVGTSRSGAPNDPEAPLSLVTMLEAALESGRLEEAFAQFRKLRS